ncbi:sigma 54-interacting transcriptional regulator [Paenibacillus hodogayensis]
MREDRSALNKTMEINSEMLQKILDHSSDEIFVVDGNKRIVYVNGVCERHYGLKPADVIGKNVMDLYAEGYWTPSIIPDLFQSKKTTTMKQTTYLGTELITTAVPLLNGDGDIELAVITSQQMLHYKRVVQGAEESGEKEGEEGANPAASIITNSAKMKQILKLCQKVAPIDSTILIQGESGTGKGVLAHYIHAISNRRKGTFLTINCAAIPEELLESELFGYEQGAFTGATRSGKPGLIEAANEGTLFMDEIGELSLKLQAKLLQVIQEHEFIPVGGRKTKKVDIRIIAATNRNLQEMVQQKRWREDLYYRLNVIDIKIVPLRERREDITPLTYYFLNKFNKKYGTNQLISEDVIALFNHYPWPGNLRQLEHLIERLVITTDSVIEVQDLPDLFQKYTAAAARPSALDAALEELERSMVTSAYQRLQSSRKVAAELAISQTKASRLIRKYVMGLNGDKGRLDEEDSGL